MPRTIFKTEQPVILEGYQAVLKPSKYGYSMSAIVDQDFVDQLESDRTSTLEWAKSKLKNPKRSTLKPEPWEEVSEGKYKVKFSWNDTARPPVVDSEGTPITNSNVPLYSGSKVKLACYQKPYILKDGVTYGTSLKLVGVQVVSLSESAGTSGESAMDVDDVAQMFGTTQGFVASAESVSEPEPVTETVEDDDF